MYFMVFVFLGRAVAHQVPGPAVTNDHKLENLKQHKFILSALEARSPRSRCQQAELPPEVLGEDPSCLSRLLGALGVPWLVAA